ncbi:MAG TPA: transposase, partial [Geobacteraceae bacterium]|nr:transposase [Geobacteraceae bacterium]
EYPGAIYHVTSRGNDQKDVFKSQRDREKFLEYLATATERYGAVIHVYCLLSNHYHLLLETPEGNLSQIMRHINGAYTTYFNVKRKRAGHLFQGRYKAILVEADEYAAELSRYIHLNPVRAGITRKPEEYRWSTYRVYIGENNKATYWLKTEFILGFFGGKAPVSQEKYRELVENILDSEYDSPLKATVASTVLGSEEFVREISERYLGEKRADRNVPAVKELAIRPAMDEIIKKIKAKLIGSDELIRNVSIYSCQKYSGAKQKEIGERFGISDAAVSQASRRLVLKAEKDQQMKKMLRRVDALIGHVRS